MVMKKIFLLVIIHFVLLSCIQAQDDVYPAAPYKGLLFITNATVHVGNGQVLQNTTIQVNNGKIEKIGRASCRERV